MLCQRLVSIGSDETFFLEMAEDSMQSVIEYWHQMVIAQNKTKVQIAFWRTFGCIGQYHFQHEHNVLQFIFGHLADFVATPEGEEKCFA